METLYADRIEDHIVNLARHYARSANPAKAVEYCLRACQQSSDRASYAEALRHFETGLVRLQELPDDDRRAELELDLRNTVNFALTTFKGYGSPEAERSAARALELSQHPGVSWEKSWRALSGLFLPTMFRDVWRAIELATQLLAMAEQHGNNELTAESSFNLAYSQMFAGNFESADKSFDRAISMFETMPKVTAGLGSRQNMTHAQSYSVSARNRWFLGFPDRGLKLLNNALGLARASDLKTVDDTVRANALSFFSLVGERKARRTSYWPSRRFGTLRSLRRSTSHQSKKRWQ